MSIEATAWLGGETTATPPPASDPTDPTDPTPWAPGGLEDSAALPEIVPEGGTPTPIPPTDPTPFPTDSLVTGGGSCCCPTTPTTCYCPMADVVCVAISGLPVPSLGVTGEPLSVNGSWTYTYGTAGYPSAVVGWFPAYFSGVTTTSGTTGCNGPGYPTPGPPLPAVGEYTYYGPVQSGFGNPLPGCPVLSCTQRDGSGASSSYTYFSGLYIVNRATVTACQDNRFPGGSPLFGLSYDWNWERDTLFAGWTAAALLYTPPPGYPGFGGAGGTYSLPGALPPAPTVVECSADSIKLAIPWTRWQYREDGIRTRTAFYAPGPAEHNGTVVTNTVTSGTATVTITRGPCPFGGTDPGPALRAVAALHPKAAELMAADPLLRGGCCG